MKLYLETSVPNFLFHDDAPEKQVVTRHFFRWLRHCSDELFTSVIVEAEIRRAPPPLRSSLLQAMADLPLTILELTPEAVGLGQVYVQRRIIPQRFLNDALQVAIAVCQRMDVVVSWNMKHLVNVRKVAAMNRVNLEYGLPPIRIHTPEEVMSL